MSGDEFALVIRNLYQGLRKSHDKLLLTNIVVSSRAGIDDNHHSFNSVRRDESKHTISELSLSLSLSLSVCAAD